MSSITVQLKILASVQLGLGQWNQELSKSLDGSKYLERVGNQNMLDKFWLIDVPI